MIGRAHLHDLGLFGESWSAGRRCLDLDQVRGGRSGRRLDRGTRRTNRHLSVLTGSYADPILI